MRRTPSRNPFAGYFYGNILFQLQRYSDAKRQYEEANRIDPGHANAYNNLAAVYYLFKMYPMAIEVLDRAEANGIEDLLNLKLKEMVYRAAERPTNGILQEDFPPSREGGPSVMRFALAVRAEGPRTRYSALQMVSAARWWQNS